MTSQAIMLQSLTGQVIQAELSDGMPIIVRAIQPTDEALMREGIAQLSPQSRYLRFFSGRPVPVDSVIQKLVNADGYDHIAWGALLARDPDHPAIGAVHAFRDSAHASSGEVSFAIIDAYHGLGLARMLMAVLLIHCRLAQMEKLDVHMLAENRPAAKLVGMLGGQRSNLPSAVSEYAVDVDLALRNLRAQTENHSLQDVFRRLVAYS